MGSTSRNPTIRRVVVVDDESAFADVLTLALTMSGYEVATAGDGLSGLAVIVSQRPDIVVLDYTMPVLDGAGVLRAMAADPRTASVPVLLVSSMPRAVVEHACHGYTELLSKPFSLEVLLAAIHRVLESKATEDRAAVSRVSGECVPLRGLVPLDAHPAEQRKENVA
jgi:CheY-like chemotaxis protein